MSAASIDYRTDLLARRRLRISPLVAASKSVQGAIRISEQGEAMNSARANATSGVKPKCIGRDSYLSQGRSIMRMQKHEPVTQHDHGGQCGCPTAPPGYLGDDACRGDKIHSRQHRDWRPGGILGGTGFPARAEYDSISEACTICSRVLVSTIQKGSEKSPGPFSCLKSPRHAGFWPTVRRVGPARKPVSGHVLGTACLFSLFAPRAGASTRCGDWLPYSPH